MRTSTMISPTRKIPEREAAPPGVMSEMRTPWASLWEVILRPYPDDSRMTRTRRNLSPVLGVAVCATGAGAGTSTTGAGALTGAGAEVGAGAGA